jgi:hypothetical protein
VTGQTQYEAIHNFVESLQLALSCVTNAVLRRATYNPRIDPQVLILNDNSPVLLPGAEVALHVAQHVRVSQAGEPSGSWYASSVGYYYVLMNRRGAEILGYHWHPIGQSSVTEPHLHLGPGVGVGNRPTAEAHLPTGSISLEDVLRLAIASYSVIPRRSDWDSTLRATKAAREPG